LALRSHFPSLCLRIRQKYVNIPYFPVGANQRANMVKQKLMIISERFGINFRIVFSVDLCDERKESTVNKRYSK